MKSRRSLLPIFFLFFFLAVVTFFTSGTPFGRTFTGFFEQLVIPIQGTVFHSSLQSNKKSTPESKLQEENTKLMMQLADLEKLKKENAALQDQFKTEKPSAKKTVTSASYWTKGR